LSDLADWIEARLGYRPLEIAPFERALTHSSHAGDSYERQECLGDRVLGLIMAEWLYETFPDEPEGNLSKRFNALVTGSVCAAVVRDLGVAPYLRLGKQARDDGAAGSDNVLGDVMEALLGALYRERGLDAARDVVRRLWADRIHAGAAGRTPPRHPGLDPAARFLVPVDK
jgi:ribonuclease-3